LNRVRKKENGYYYGYNEETGEKIKTKNRIKKSLPINALRILKRRLQH